MTGWRRDPWRCLVACLAIGLALAGASGGAPAVARAPTSIPSATAGPEAVAAYGRLVAELADESMEGRGPGTRGLERARDYLVGHFKSIGLKPACLPAVSRQATGKSYLQAFEIRMGVKVADQALSIADEKNKLLARADAKRQFVVLGFSASGAFAGPAVFAGYGIVAPKRGYDSYRGLANKALAGKVVIAYRFEPQDAKGRSRWGGTAGRFGRWSRSAALVNKARWAAERGAAAILVVNPPSQPKAPALHSTRGTAYGPTTKIPILHIAPGVFGQVLKHAGRADPDQAMRALQKAADAGAGGPVVPLNGVTVRGKVALKPMKVQLDNVVARLPGAGKLAKEFLIVGAHYDHVGRGEFGSRVGPGKVHPGADDNASGTAGVLMLAKRFADRAARGDALPGPPASRRTILFAAFSAEERGLLGSRHMAENLDDFGIRPADVAAMINLDMIGRMRNKKLQIWAVDSGDGWRPIVDRATRRSGLNVTSSGLGIGPSDHAIFYRKKIPVLSFFTGIHRDYHTPRDTADKINAAGAVEALAIAESVLSDVWTAPKRMAYKPPAAGSAAAMMAMATDAWLGAVPDILTPAKDGCRLAQVVAAGPADKAGIKAGDVLAAWDGQPIADVSGLLVAMHAGKPGQRVTLTVRRGAKTLRIAVTLGKR